jgi:hypothetical protein
VAHVFQAVAERDIVTNRERKPRETRIWNHKRWSWPVAVGESGSGRSSQVEEMGGGEGVDEEMSDLREEMRTK